MEDKIPCIKCTNELWKYIEPYLKDWGYYSTEISGKFDELFNILTLNWDDKIDCFGFADYSIIKDKNSELVTDVNEFLKRAAKLKGFTYKRKDIEIYGIKIEPGMVIETSITIYIAFPTENGIGFVDYNGRGWRETIPNDIQTIRNICKGNDICDGNILWEKPKKVTITKQEIAEKFGYDVNNIEIIE